MRRRSYGVSIDRPRGAGQHLGANIFCQQPQPRQGISHQLLPRVETAELAAVLFDADIERHPVRQTPFGVAVV